MQSVAVSFLIMILSIILFSKNLAVWIECFMFIEQ